MRTGLFILSVLALALLPAWTAAQEAETTPIVESATAVEAGRPADSPVATLDPPAELAFKVAVITVHGTIDYGLQKSLERRKALALEAGAQVLIFEMDSYGGGLEAGIEIADLINNIKTDSNGRVMTVAYVAKKAISAGALISLACRETVMRQGTTIGDCQAIMVDPREGMKEAPEKIQTTVRAMVRKYAQSNGYPELVCEAMVDPDIEAWKITFAGGAVKYLTPEEMERLSAAEKSDIKEKEQIVAKGKLLTMSDTEARKWGISRASVKDLAEAQALYARPDATITRYETNWSEEMVRFLNSAAVAGVLMTVGVLALYMAFKTPGFGAPEAIAILCFAILFLSKYLVGLASTVDVLIFAVGIILLAIEIFVIPGFGVTGFAGIACIVISLILASQKFVLPQTTFEMATFLRNILSVVGSLVAATALFMLMVRYLPSAPGLKRLVLGDTQRPELGYVVGSAEKRSLVGAKGVARSALRPVGRAEINGETMIVMAESEFIEPGERIRVSRVEGNRIQVTRIESGPC